MSAEVPKIMYRNINGVEMILEQQLDVAQVIIKNNEKILVAHDCLKAKPKNLIRCHEQSAFGNHRNLFK